MIRGSFWISAGRAAVNAISFISTIVLARLLVPADFGLVALGLTVLAIIGAVTDLSLSQALVRHREPSDDHFHTAWTLNVGRALLVALILAAGARPLAAFYHEPRLETLIYSLTVGVMLGGLRNPRLVLLSKQLIFWQEFLLNVAEKIVSFAVAVGVALYFRTFWALVAGVIAGQLASVILSYLITPYRPRLMVRHARELWSFSVWLTLGRAMNTINWRFDQLLVGGLLGRAALGFYSVGDNLAQTATREATLPLISTLFPAFARIADEADRLRAAYQRAQRLVTAIALPIGVGFAFVAKPFVVVAMGDKWMPVVPVVQGLSANFAIQTLGSLAIPLGLAKGETKLLFRRDLQVFIMRLPLVTVGMLAWGLPGLIYARVIGTFPGTLINLLLVRQLIGLSIREQLKANARSLSSVAIMSAGLLMMNLTMPTMSPGIGGVLTQLAVMIAAGASLYVGSSALLWLAAGRPEGPEREILSLLKSRSKAGDLS